MSDMAYIMETQDPRELWLVDGENKFKVSRDMYWLLASKGADLPPIHHITELLNENDKLRKLVALWSVINKHMSLCATTDCGQCLVSEECGEIVYLEGLLGIDSKELSWRVQERMVEVNDAQAENARMRELVSQMYNDMQGVLDMSTDTVWVTSISTLRDMMDYYMQDMAELGMPPADYEKRMRELGMEL